MPPLGSNPVPWELISRQKHYMLYRYIYAIWGIFLWLNLAESPPLYIPNAYIVEKEKCSMQPRTVGHHEWQTNLDIKIGCNIQKTFMIHCFAGYEFMPVYVLGGNWLTMVLTRCCKKLFRPSTLTHCLLNATVLHKNKDTQPSLVLFLIKD